MFSGNRKFNGRQGEQIYNEELYKLYKILKHFLDKPEDVEKGPETKLEQSGALWLDNQSSPNNGHLMYNENGEWKPIFNDWLSLIKDIRSEYGKPESGIEGQLWISDEGVLHWFNGSIYVPIKSRVADTVEYDVSAFENFLIIDPLKMSGGYIIDNLAHIARIANNIVEWRSGINYKIGDMVCYTFSNEENPRFYIYSEKNVTWSDVYHVSANTIQEDIDAGYLEPVELKAQYLIPSEVIDKVFINGFYTGDDVYEKQSDVCIQISLSKFQGKTVAAVHVNPVALSNIKKRLIKINRSVDKNNVKTANYGLVEINTTNTEFYGLKDGFGQFLVKHEDYEVVANGIKIKGNALEQYDYVYCITYEFLAKVKNFGKLFKEKIDLSNQTCIWLGKVGEEYKNSLMVFSQGLCLDDFYYSYDKDGGMLKFNGFDKTGSVTSDPSKMETSLFADKTDVVIIKFDKKTNIGIFTEETLNNGRVDAGETTEGTYLENNITRYSATIPYPDNIVHPLIFANGIFVDINNPNDCYVKDGNIVINNVTPGSSYYIVDSNINGTEMYVASGTIGNDNVINVKDQDIIYRNYQPIVFVDGLLVSPNDYDLNNRGLIKINGLTEGQSYTLLKTPSDSTSNLLFDGVVSFTTIPLDESVDDVLVYVENNLIVDGGSCISTSEGTTNVKNNEVKYIKHNDAEGWYSYSADTDSWIAISETDKKAELDMTTSGYTVGKKTLNMLQNFGEAECVYYAYKYANTIERPLVRGYTANHKKEDDMLLYIMEDKYPLYKNALSVWIYGVKQNIEEYFENGVYGFKIPIPTDGYGEEVEIFPTAYYVIEWPESGEYKSCITETLKKSINNNIYITNNILLSPGIPRVFIDGYRQPQTAFNISDANTLILMEPILSPKNDMVEVICEDGEIDFVRAIEYSTLQIEIRHDYKIREQTVTLTEETINKILQGSVAIFDLSVKFDNNQYLEEDLFNAEESEISIYVNGASCGIEFLVDREAQTLVLEIAKLNPPEDENYRPLQKGDKITFEWR